MPKELEVVLSAKGTELVFPEDNDRFTREEDEILKRNGFFKFRTQQGTEMACKAKRNVVRKIS